MNLGSLGKTIVDIKFNRDAMENGEGEHTRMGLLFTSGHFLQEGLDSIPFI